MLVIYFLRYRGVILEIPHTYLPYFNTLNFHDTIENIYARTIPEIEGYIQQIAFFFPTHLFNRQIFF